MKEVDRTYELGEELPLEELVNNDSVRVEANDGKVEVYAAIGELDDDYEPGDPDEGYGFFDAVQERASDDDRELQRMRKAL